MDGSRPSVAARHDSDAVHRTPPGWLEETLRAFQRRHPHVMLSCEGHSRLTQWGLKAMSLLPFPKPYWQYIPFLNRVRRMLPFAA